MAKSLTVFRGGKVRTIKAGVSLEQLKENGYFERHPETIVVKVPTINTLMRWDEQGISKAVDGCRVEPDGTCQHGCPSWLLTMGFI